MSTKTCFSSRDVESLYAELVNYAHTNGYTFSNGCQLNPAKKNATISLATILDWMVYILIEDYLRPEELAKEDAVKMFTEVFKKENSRVKLYKEWRQLSWWALRIIDEYFVRPVLTPEVHDDRFPEVESWEEWMARHGFEVKKKGAQPRPAPVPRPEPEPEPKSVPLGNNAPPGVESEKSLAGMIWRILNFGRTKVLMAYDDGKVISACITGPAGVGKTYTIKWLTRHLDGEVFVITAGSSKTDYLGYKDANGNYHPSPLVSAIWYAQEHPDQLVVILIDELDMCPPDTSGVLFPLFASRELETIQTGKLKCPKNVVLFAAMNTMGDGPSDDFVGRTPVDKAMLDRFAFIYNAEFEEDTARRICKDWALVDLILDWNQSCKEAILTKSILSYRHMDSFTMALEAGFSLEFAVGKIVNGQTRGNLETIYEGMKDHYSKYSKILRKAIDAIPESR